MNPPADSLALLAQDSVRDALAQELGFAIEYHARCDSTQERALALAGDPTRRAVIVVADEQSAGRGTRGRTWLAPAGSSLLASWLFRPAPGDAALVSLLAGVAVARAVEAQGARGAAVKWPNDVHMNGRKLAGVLASGTTTGAESVLIIGIGVNVHQTEPPMGLETVATSLAVEGFDVDRLALLSSLTRELSRIALPAERAVALNEWRARALFLGGPVEVSRAGEEVLRGIARDVAPDGALVVETAYGPQRIIAGDVTVRGG